MRRVKFTFGCTYAAALLACSPAAHQDLVQEGEQVAELGAASRLSPAEQAAYTDNLVYLYSLTKSGVPVELNYADPRQHALVVARLKLTGKTPENSPYLFQLIEAHRQKHLAAKLPPGTFANQTAAQSLVEGTADIQSMHYIEEGKATKINSLQAEVVGAASSTFLNGLAYARLDISETTTGGTAVAPVVAKEEFTNPEGVVGGNVSVSTSGKVSLSSSRAYVASSFSYDELYDGTFVSTFVKTQFGSTNPQVVATPPTFSGVNHTAPIPTIKAPLDKISACMNRSWTTDCDYVIPPTGLTWPVQMPLAGSITITSNHIFDQQWLNDIQWALNQVPAQDPGVDVGSLKLVLTNVGGGCDVTDGNTLTAKMAQFWNLVTLSADKKTMTWNLIDANSAFFDDGCAQVQNLAKLTARIPLRVVTVPPAATTYYDSSLTLTSDPGVLRPNYLIAPITITNSCLAEGTQIELGNGKLAPIESLRIGQNVSNPFDRADHALRIMDTAKGSELSPMVRIRDERGATLLLTEMHPLATPDRGMVQARHLKTGDIVLTKRGPSKLTEVSREAYNGKVYNLKVGSEAELASLGEDQTVVYANGFMVGDGQIQSKYEKLSMQQENSRTVEQIPERWRRDYQLSHQQQ